MEKPEDVIYEEWRRCAKLATGARGISARRAYVAIADSLQYLLQDYSSYGHDLVWGHEGRKRRRE